MIDWNRVHELQDEVGQEDFEEIVTLFIEEVDAAMASLDAAGAGDGLADALHFLKGCALNLGFRMLAKHCAEGEIALRDGNETAVSVDEIRKLYVESRAAFLQRLAEAA